MLQKSYQTQDNDVLQEQMTALSLSCIGENHRMASWHLREAMNFHDQAAKAFDEGHLEQMKLHKKSAKQHHYQAFEYSAMAERIPSNLDF
jgi:hypothetical protein